MKKSRKIRLKKESHSTDSSLSLSILAYIPEANEKVHLFLESIQKIKKPFLKDYEVLFLTKQPEIVKKEINQYEEFTNLLEKKVFQIIPITSENPIITDLNLGRQHARKRNILIFEVDHLAKPFNFEEFFSIKQNLLDSTKFLIARFREQPDEIKSTIHWPVILFKNNLAEYLFSSYKDKPFDYQYILFSRLQKLNIPVNDILISQVSPFVSTKAKSTSFLKRIIRNFNSFTDWYISKPINEIKSLPHRKYEFIKEPSFFRLLFVTIAVVLFFLLPILSFESGMSGDEDKHYHHAKKVYQYYATKGEDKSAIDDPQHKLNYYGQSFDLFTYVFIKAFKIDKVYEWRHIFIALFGFLTILVSGLLATFLMGYRAGVLIMAFMFLAPRFLGHSFNNPLDIPFAFGYTFTIYQIFLFLMKLPVFSVRNAVWITLGIAFTISIRIGGLLLIPYAFFFAGLYFLFKKWDFKFFTKKNYLLLRKGLIYLIIISITGFFISLLPWPYGLEKPLENPFNALKMMSNISVAIRVLFNGDIHWSNMLPWYYIPMNIFFTVPVIILLGFLLNLFIIIAKIKTPKAIFQYFLYFAVIFPIIYIIYKKSNVYGGWRHLLFVFPSMAVLAVSGYEYILRTARSKYITYGIYLLLAAGFIHPIKHIITNHPFEYIYFNEFMGNVKKAYGRFENDYYLNSLRQGSEWLIDNIISELPRGESNKTIVTTNANIDYYFRHYQDQVKTIYTRYYDRGAKDWDYAVFFCNYIHPYQLKNNIWPPNKTIHTVNVDHVPICAVVKRESKLDYQAFELLQQRNYLTGIPMLETVIEKEPHNEYAMLRLAEAYIATSQYDKAIQTVDKCLEIYPDYDKAFNLKGIVYLNQKDYTKAISTFQYITKINYRFASAYHNMALVYLRLNDAETAKSHLLKAIEVNRRFKPAYLTMGEILQRQGNTEEAKRYLDAANSL